MKINMNISVAGYIGNESLEHMIPEGRRDSESFLSIFVVMLHMVLLKVSDIASFWRREVEEVVHLIVTDIAYNNASHHR